jgi:mannonate dehydratase
VARIFSSFEGFERASQAIASPAWGLLLCIGCWTEMGGTANVLRGIKHFGPQGRIVYVHFRDIKGTGQRLLGVLRRLGDLDVTAAMRALEGVRLQGRDHRRPRPAMVGDEGLALPGARLPDRLHPGAAPGCRRPDLVAASRDRGLMRRPDASSRGGCD